MFQKDIKFETVMALYVVDTFDIRFCEEKKILLESELDESVYTECVAQNAELTKASKTKNEIILRQIMK